MHATKSMLYLERLQTPARGPCGQGSKQQEDQRLQGWEGRVRKQSTEHLGAVKPLWVVQSQWTWSEPTKSEP